MGVSQSTTRLELFHGEPAHQNAYQGAGLIPTEVVPGPLHMTHGTLSHTSYEPDSPRFRYQEVAVGGNRSATIGGLHQALAVEGQSWRRRCDNRAC